MNKRNHGNILLVEILSNEMKKQEFNFRNRGEKRSPLLFSSVLRRLANSEENILFFCELINNSKKKPKDLKKCFELIEKMIQYHFDFIDKYKKIYSEDMDVYLRSMTSSGDILDYKDFYMSLVFEKTKNKFSLENSETKNNKNDSKDEVSQLREEIQSLKSFMEGLLQKTGGAK